jgi:hypothetical protein
MAFTRSNFLPCVVSSIFTLRWLSGKWQEKQVIKD